ncbi:hypothetical protein GLAREA_00665 [Glarea lozoyensis ATCC 20868]|uniref:Uncharacterized protein n=1 Tax=Glarea lozoyensis (strain ATCC 20868 / MF5171) TaxID=1116229 RepID=S3CV24_GLAL2|nr:uncharacterized protein GLAREA_00665 [Glarea lozoyensis ATCC 20868]EPE29505.1 hypothetical protein GLAREA_00665 [Glarea lozoyensis ATCC 20868]
MDERIRCKTVCGRTGDVREEKEKTKPVPGLDFEKALELAVDMLRRASAEVGIEKGEVFVIDRMTFGKPRFPAEDIEVRSIAA